METFQEYGSGRPVLLLHGGAGPLSVIGFAQLLASRAPVRVIVPTHPGFGGTPRPAELHSAAALAAYYADLLDAHDWSDVVVLGNSIGGWVAAELALFDADRTTRRAKAGGQAAGDGGGNAAGDGGQAVSGGGRRVAGLILVDAVGIEVPGEPVLDIFPLTLAQLADYSYHRPDAFRVDESTFDAAQRAGLAANRAALRAYAEKMVDPALRDRLAGLDVPVTVVWGASDRVVTPAYGRAFAAAIPDAKFVVLPESGHVPQIESPEALLAVVEEFLGA